MVTNTINVFSLGTFADLDTFEGDYSNENNLLLMGQTFGSAGSPLYANNLTTLTLNDADNSGVVSENDAGQIAEQITAHGITESLDNTTEWVVTLTYADGSTAFTEMVLLQDTSGRLFLAPFVDGSLSNDPLYDGPIKSITLNGLWGDGFDGVFVNLENVAFLCLGPGTLIETPDGPQQVGTLCAGDLVETLDCGAQPLIWTGKRQLRFPHASESQKPFQFKAGCFGPGLPAHDLIASPQHRILCKSPNGERLAIAKSFAPLAGVRQMAGKREVTYHSLLFDRHQIIFANGLAVESFYPGRHSMSLLRPLQRLQIVARLPGILDDPETAFGRPARPLIKHQEALACARRGQLDIPAGEAAQYSQETIR